MQRIVLTEPMYEFRSRNSARPITHTTRLRLEYTLPFEEVGFDSHPERDSAHTLFTRWSNRIVQGTEDHSHAGLGRGWLHIRWGVTSPDGGFAEHAPFQVVDPPDEDFLTHFTWPTETGGGELQWPSLLVEDKWWRRDHDRDRKSVV